MSAALLKRLLGAGAVIAAFLLYSWAVAYKAHQVGTLEGELTVAKLQLDISEANLRVEQANVRVSNLEAERERLINQAFVKVRDERDSKLAKVAARLDAAVVSLLDRPERRERAEGGDGLPGDTRAECSGASGAELARGDGLFLVRYAADVARLQAHADACYAALAEARKASLRPQQTGDPE